ncbi:MAG: N-acetylglucosamine-6-phosphate deacetylase [Clostridiales bacterium]|nr:N-acetylglucosamine-6-phosphate deacetylase [Clostridiales bacterium]
MKAIINGILLIGDQEVTGKALLFDETIQDLVPANEIPAGCEVIDAKGNYVSPGLIDLHIHGYLGEDTSDGSLEGIRTIAEGVIKNGVTAFLPTTMTVSWPEIETALNNVRQMVIESKKGNFTGAQVLGAHAEGPFINPKRKGAQSAEAILPPDANKILAHKDVIKIITMAPEMQNGIEVIQKVTQTSNIVVSIGHTDASFDQAAEAIKAGASHITHLFNAMTGLNHRDPGVVGAALTHPVSVELIADTFHVHPALFGMLRDTKKDLFVLVTDCTRAGGLGDGEYTLGGQPIFVKGIECRLADGTIAGSVLKLNEAVYNLRERAGITTAQAVCAASHNAARVIGAENHKGSLERGKDADIVLFDHNLNALSVFIGGQLKYQKGSDAQ